MSQSKQNPFAFKVGDKKVQKQHAPQYYPPQKRKEMKEYLTKTNIKFNQQVMPGDQPSKDLFCKPLSFLIYLDFKDQSLSQSNQQDGNAIKSNKQHKFSVNRDKVIGKQIKQNKSQGRPYKTTNDRRVIQKQKWNEMETMSHSFYNNFIITNPSLVQEQVQQTKLQGKALQKVLKESSLRFGYEKTMDYKTMKKILHEEPSLRFKEYIPKVEEKRNKKNDSKVVLQIQRQLTNEHLMQQPITSYQHQLSQMQKIPSQIDKTEEQQYNQLIEKAKETIFKTFLEREKKRLIQSMEKQVKVETKSNIFALNGGGGSPVVGGKMAKSGTQFDRFHLRSNSVQPSRPQSSHGYYNYQPENDIQLYQKMKRQNFHISGDRPSTTQVTDNRRGYHTVSNERSKNQHYRTSFQQQFQKNQIDSEFKREIDTIKQKMQKPNIQFRYQSNGKPHSETILEKSLYNENSLNYDNINMINHIPFMENDQPDQKSRFNTNYKFEHNLRQDKKRLQETFNQNNLLNKKYMERLLSEHHYLGKMNDTEQKNALNSENQVSFYRTRDFQNSILQEIAEGTAPQQLSKDFKQKIEMQNCTIKQTQICGDKFIEDKKKSLSYGQGLMDMVMGKSLNNEAKTLKPTFSATDFQKLNYRDQMEDHRKTNFHFGIQNNHQSDILKERSKTIEDNSPIAYRNQTQQVNQLAQSQTLNFNGQTFINSNNTFQQRNFNQQRPSTAQSNQQRPFSSGIQLVTPADTIKRQHQSRVVFGTDKSSHKVTTDYRNNYLWTIPKFAV